MSPEVCTGGSSSSIWVIFGTLSGIHKRSVLEVLLREFELFLKHLLSPLSKKGCTGGSSSSILVIFEATSGVPIRYLKVCTGDAEQKKILPSGRVFRTSPRYHQKLDFIGQNLLGSITDVFSSLLHSLLWIGSRLPSRNQHSVYYTGFASEPVQKLSGCRAH